jgi:DNA-binding NarL/FixJ family response regulator
MSSNNNDCTYNEREKKVLELYNQGNTTREIAEMLRMSLTYIGFILKKGQVNHGIVMYGATTAITNLPMKKLLRLTCFFQVK